MVWVLAQPMDFLIIQHIVGILIWILWHLPHTHRDFARESIRLPLVRCSRAARCSISRAFDGWRDWVLFWFWYNSRTLVPMQIAITISIAGTIASHTFEIHNLIMSLRKSVLCLPHTKRNTIKRKPLQNNFIFSDSNENPSKVYSISNAEYAEEVMEAHSRFGYTRYVKQKIKLPHDRALFLVSYTHLCCFVFARLRSNASLVSSEGSRWRFYRLGPCL